MSHSGVGTHSRSASRSGSRPTSHAAPPRRPGRGVDDPSTAIRTLVGLAASALAVMPLKGLLRDYGWLLDVWLSMIVAVGPAVLLRLRRPPSALDIWPGIVLLVPWLTLRFVPDHAYGGLIPSGQTMHDLSRLLTALHHTTTDAVAPVQSTPAIRLVLCALLALLAALIDLIAVVGHRGALAGVPLLVVYTVAGAVPREPVSWAWFVCAAAGYLLLLSIDANDQLQSWGRRIGRSGLPRTAFVVPVSAQRVGVLAIVIALVLPLIAPSQRRNLIADAFHHSGSGSGNGSGFGGGSISPFAYLQGELRRNTQRNLMTVHVEQGGVSAAKPPFYLVADVLSDATTKGWQEGDDGPTTSLDSNDYSTDPPSQQTQVIRDFSADFTVTGLGGNPVVFSNPIGLGGLGSDARWSHRDGVVKGLNMRKGQTYSEQVRESAPSADELAAASDAPSGMDRWLKVPTLPASVRQQVESLLGGARATTPFAKASAIFKFFTDPVNNFQYSLKTKHGDSGSDIVDFLKNRTGFCQQYAATMGIMLRMAGVPARVMLGYEHPLPDSKGNFTVTSFDAHAWVEAYFQGIGWVPFDPTPPAGLDGGPASDLPYAQHNYGGGNRSLGGNPRASSSGPTAPVSGGRSSTASKPKAGIGAGAGDNSTDYTPLWVLLGVLVVLLVGLVPAVVRMSRRRRRLAAGRRGDPDPLWAELSDTALDLGYVWSAARSPRQVATCLEPDAHDPQTLTALATAVERHRYGPAGADAVPADLARSLAKVTARMRSTRSARTRLLAFLWPASLGLHPLRRTKRH